MELTSKLSLILLVLFSLYCSSGYCRPSDDEGLELNDAVQDYQDTNGQENDDDDEEEGEDPNYRPKIPVFISAPVSISGVGVGEDVDLPCTVENAEDYVRIWRNGTEIIYQERTPLTRDFLRVSLRDNFTLHISNVQTYDSNLYTCEVLTTNNGGPKIVHTLRVKEAVKIDKFLPDGPNVIVVKGQPLSLVCHASGNPQPKVFWTRVVRGSKSPEYLEGTNYTIPSVNREHAGVYECTAKNVNNTEKRSIDVVVHYEPEVSIKRDLVNAAEGKVSEMHCTVYAEPAATLEWVKDGKKLSSNDHVQLFTAPDKPHKHILKIENTKAEDFGHYYCIATNDLGVTRKTITLSGTPLRPVFDRAEYAGDKKSPQLVWTVESLSPIKSYELQYRKQEEENWTLVHPKVLTSANGVYYTVVHDLQNLNPGTYEAVLKAQNAYGWSYPSPPNTFAGEDHESNEIPQEPSGPNPNGASQFRISVAMILSILVAKLFC